MWSNFNLNFGENDKDIEIFIVIAQLFFAESSIDVLKIIFAILSDLDFFLLFRPAEIEKILKNDKKQPFLAFYGMKNGSKIKREKKSQ